MQIRKGISKLNSEGVLPGELTLESLFKEYYARLVHFSFQLVKDIATAEDIAQDAFIKYWHQRETVTANKVTVKSFLYVSVKNASLNLLRHQKVIKKTEDKLSLSIVDEKNIINNIIQSEVLAEVYQALATLPESCQRISRMSYLEGLKNQEIADALGVSVNTVKTQKQRGLQLLRLRLSPEIFNLLLLLLIN